jgi:16S rRNA processing protein RimM
MENDAKLLTVGKITSVFGVKGWVKIYAYTSPIENIFDYQPWTVKTPQGDKAVEVDQWQRHGKGLIAHLKGVDDRDIAQTYCQSDCVVANSQLPPLDEGEYYWSQLMGLHVVSEYSGERQLLGKVQRLVETGANDVLVVRGCKGSIDERERLIPFVPEQYILNVDIAVGEMLIDWDPEF